MQAIETKFLPPTNFRGPRIKASCQRGSATFDWINNLSTEENHRAAANMLCQRFAKEDAKKYGDNKSGWLQPLVHGAGPKETGFHVFSGGENQ